MRAPGLLLLAALTLPSASAAAPVVTRVSYIAGASVYVDAGRADGLGAADTLTVWRGSSRVAQLRVNVLSNHRASCDTLWTALALAPGDSVRFHESGAVSAVAVAPAAILAPAPATPAPAATPAPLATATPAKRPIAPRLRGRIGARWLSVDSPGAARFTQPSLDARADETGLLNGHLDVALDVRNRRTTRSFAGSGNITDNSSRFYRAALTLHGTGTASERSFTVGRQLSPTLAVISLFDGALLQSGNAHHRYGLFTGTQPDPLRYSFSGDIVQSGAFFEWHQPPVSVRHWSVATGGVTSQEKGQTNRDFVFAQTMWFSPGFNGTFSQEVDVNTGWRRENGAATLSPTSTFLTMRVPFGRTLALDGGFDNRHNVRLYRDRLTPETQFDDAYRQGAWGGATLTLGEHVRLNGEAREGSGGTPSHAWSAGGGLERFTRWNAGVRGRISRLTSGPLESRLVSGSLSVEPAMGSRIEFTAGQRGARNTDFAIDDTEDWQSLDLDVALLRRAYLDMGFEQDRGTSGTTRQLQAGLAWRF